MAGVKGRSGGWRPGAGRKPGTKNEATLKREALLTALAKNIENVLIHVENERQMRRHQAEVIPTILKRLTEIERHLALRETHRGPTVAATKVFRNTQAQVQPTNGGSEPMTLERRPERPPRHAAAEALFKRDGT